MPNSETLADIIGIMRSEPLYNPHGDPALVEANKTLRHYAYRIEAAARRELADINAHAESEERWANHYFEAALKSAATAKRLREALEAVLAAYKSGAIHTCAEHYRDEWDDELCDLKAKVEAALFVHIDVPKRIHDAEDVHTDSANDIQDPQGNAAALRAALENLIPVAVHGYSTRAWLLTTSHEDENSINLKQLRRITEDAAKALENARAALAAPHRNCDIYATLAAATDAWRIENRTWQWYGDNTAANYMKARALEDVREFLDWLFAQAEEGGAECK